MLCLTTVNMEHECKCLLLFNGIMQDTDSYICKSNEKDENPDQKAPKEALGPGSALFAKY